ncbi:ATP-binding protein [Kitasatospora sp. NBC_01302]|uniref:ATP-binding protein n=1 Tax=Kitasatospora sp. NBC_01302 TaxID=2903575 RepID=UPI002E1644A8|nr:ATP-binding protein [Kitasatospora sp. NBC_01302]
MKQAIKVAGTAALGVAIATVAAGAASAAAPGGLPALPDTSGVTGALGKAPAVDGPVKQTTGLLDQKSGTQAPAAQAPAAAAPEAAPISASGATRGLPVGAVQGAAKQVPLSGALGSVVPLGATAPGLGG